MKINKTELLKEVKKIVKEEMLNEAGKWSTKNIDEKFYNFYASADMVSSNLERYMSDMNKGKQDDALFSLKVSYDEMPQLLKYIKKYRDAIEQELKENNKLK